MYHPTAIVVAHGLLWRVREACITELSTTGTTVTTVVKVPSIRENQGEVYFSGKSGNLCNFSGFMENQGIIFYLC